MSLLQTGGWKEALFFSTQVFTLTRRSMAAGSGRLPPRVSSGRWSRRRDGRRSPGLAGWPPS